MRKPSLVGLLLVMCFLSLAPSVSAQITSSVNNPPQEYLNSAIEFNVAGVLNEGILAYANRMAKGDKVTITTSGQGIALYLFNNNSYFLINELSYQELGLTNNISINNVFVSPNDKWFILQIDNKILSIPLTDSYMPVTAMRTEISDIYGEMLISGQLALINLGNSIETYSITANTGQLTRLSSLQNLLYNSQIALKGNILAIGQSRQENTGHNLEVYVFSGNEWQLRSTHIMDHGDWYYHVDHVAISPTNQQIFYSSNGFSYILQLSPGSSEITEINRGYNLLGSHYGDIHFVNDNVILSREYRSMRLINSQSFQQLATINTESFGSYLQQMQVNTDSIALLTDDGLTLLNPNSLAVVARLQPGEQDVALNFSQAHRIFPLGHQYLLQQRDSKLNVFKLDSVGLPEQIQSSTMNELLGHNFYYFSMSLRSMGNNHFVIFSGNNYSIIRQDQNTMRLHAVANGVLIGRNGHPLYISPKNVVTVGADLVIANGDTLSLFRLGQNNQYQFVQALVNNASGITDIAQISMLMASGNNIYTVDQQHQSISHFSILNNTLQQKKVYKGQTLPWFNDYHLRNNLLTLKGYEFLQVIRVADGGELTFLSNQLVSNLGDTWMPVGDRFVASQSWDGIKILEQDNSSGLWQNSQHITTEQLRNEYNIDYNYSLVPIVGVLALYDSQSKRFIRFDHNSAPYVTDATRLQLALNQGQTFQVALPSLISDEEDAELTFDLQHAAGAFNINSSKQLMFNGQHNESGGFAVLAADPAGLVSRINFEYQINLAPRVTGTLPTFNALEGDPVQIELAQYFTDPEGQAVQFALTSAQTGLTLSTTGLLTGRINSPGVISVNFRVSDSAGAVASHSVQITVAAKPKESSGGSLHWLWLFLLAGTAVSRVRQQH